MVKLDRTRGTPLLPVSLDCHVAIKWNPVLGRLCSAQTVRWKGSYLGKICPFSWWYLDMCVHVVWVLWLVHAFIVWHWFVAPWFHWAETDIVSHDRKAQSWLQPFCVLLARESFRLGSQEGSRYGHSGVQLLCCQNSLPPLAFVAHN